MRVIYSKPIIKEMNTFNLKKNKKRQDKTWVMKQWDDTPLNKDSLQIKLWYKLFLHQSGIFANKTLGSLQGSTLAQLTKYGWEFENIEDISICSWV